jgi:hypothetical protein
MGKGPLDVRYPPVNWNWRWNSGKKLDERLSDGGVKQLRTDASFERNKSESKEVLTPRVERNPRWISEVYLIDGRIRSYVGWNQEQEGDPLMDVDHHPTPTILPSRTIYHRT